MSSCCHVVCAGLLVLLLPALVLAQQQQQPLIPPGQINPDTDSGGTDLPVSAPSTQPQSWTTSPSTADLRQRIAQLGDEDADVREAARAALMGLRKDDLPALKAAADAEAPLLPAQVFALHEIVMQAFLSSETFQTDGSGFLGLHWPLPESDALIEAMATHDLGVVVIERIPGFGAYRLLRPGDVIVRLLDQPLVDVRSMQAFTDTVKVFRAGQPLRMAVLRQGKIIEVSIVLDPRPLEVTLHPENIVSWERTRMDKAEEYWNTQFGSLIPEDMQSFSATTQP